jgi:TRAP-type C4-dicarboxylate transport system substrate-binding protein
VRRRSALLAAAALVAVAAACDGTSGDKAGGKAEGTPIVLTLATHDRLYAYGTFAAAVERLSGGSMQLQIRNNWRDRDADYERGIIRDVRDGKVRLAIVGVRVWDTVGVDSFRALIAPFLVDSLALERRVLETPLAMHALDRIDEAGVVGIAILPGTLRRPLGFTRALVGPKDYEAATFGVRLGGVAEATLRALGATAEGYVAGFAAQLDGVELDLTTIADNGYDLQAESLTANVVLWPRIQTVIMNRQAFDALTAEQHEILRRAGREALESELARIERDEAQALAVVCEHRKLALETASSSELRALREAVQPVFDELERDEETRDLIAAIRELRDNHVSSSPASPRCPQKGGSAAKTAAALEGLWETTWTRDRLIAAGIAPKDAEALRGQHTAEFADGHFRFQGDAGSDTSATGTYTLDGDIVRLVFATGIRLQLGRPYELRWNVYRDSLTFSAAPGRETLLAFITEPYTRVR